MRGFVQILGRVEPRIGVSTAAAALMWPALADTRSHE